MKSKVAVEIKGKKKQILSFTEKKTGDVYLRLYCGFKLGYPLITKSFGNTDIQSIHQIKAKHTQCSSEQ